MSGDDYGQKPGDGSFERPPYSLDVQSREEANQYGTAPAETVPFEETAYAALAPLFAERDPVLWSKFVTHWNHVLIPAVKEARRAVGDYLVRLKARQEAAERANAAFMSQFAALDQEEEALWSDYHIRIGLVQDRLGEALEDAAAACAAVYRDFDGETLALPSPDPSLQHSREAHAALTEIPYDANEKTEFLPPVITWACSILTGAVFGLSLFSVPNIIHLSNLKHDSPLLILAAALVGVAATTLAGRAVLHLWQGAAESFYVRKRGGWMHMVVSTVITAAITALYAIVDSAGILKASGLQTSLASLSGQKTVSSPMTGAMFFAAACMGTVYMVYWAVVGWRKHRSAASNRITAAIETEAIELVREDRSNPAWAKAVSARSAVEAIRWEAVEIDRHFAKLAEALKQRRADLEARLVPIPDGPTEAEIWIIEAARTNAVGQQAFANAMADELRASHGIAATEKNQADGKQPSRQGAQKGWKARLVDGLKAFIARTSQRGSA